MMYLYVRFNHDIVRGRGNSRGDTQERAFNPDESICYHANLDHFDLCAVYELTRRALTLR